MAAQRKIYNIIFCFTLISLLFLQTEANSQSNYLYKKITVSITDLPLEKALEQISEKGGFTFAYNSKHFDEDKLVNLQIENKTVSRSLNQLFDNSVKYKVVGSHVILKKKNPPEGLSSNNKPNEYIINGYIIDSRTGEKIKEATVYEINGQIVSLSNSEGFYSLTIPAEYELQGLSYSKRGYLDTVIMVQPVQKSALNIYLNPLELPLQKLEYKSVNLKLNDLHNRRIVDALVSDEAKINSDNLVIHESKKYQISIIPFIGTNRKLSGSINNSLSFNVLAGYSGGVTGFELGGLLNIVEHNVNGSQIGGLANIVGGDTRYFQFAGLLNQNTGSVTGTQIAGISNVVLDTIHGVQIAGFNNTLHGYMDGFQISGFNNLTTQHVDGVQLTGFANVALKDVEFAQLSGFANYADNVNGGQVSGFANIAKGDVNYGQASGFANYGKSVKGIQMAGFANVSQNEVSGGQLAGFANYGKTGGKIQASGFANIALEEINGVQLTSFINYTKKVKGYQIAIFNYADTIESGLPIGIFSFVKKGLHRFEATTNDVFLINVAYKLGVKKLYNSIRFGYDMSENMALGYGIGTQINLNNKLNLNIELSSDFIFNADSTELDFSPELNINYDSINLIGTLNKLSLTIDYNLSEKLSIFAGPSFNVSVISLDNTTNSFPDFAPYSFYNKTFTDTQVKMWVGGIFGLSFTL